MVKFNEQTREDVNGFRRGDNADKQRYDLVPHLLLDRVTTIYTEGSRKYGEGNWRKAKNIETFKESAWRHFISWQKGIEDEDHFAQLIWNMTCYEELKKPKPIDILNMKLHDETNA